MKSLIALAAARSPPLRPRRRRRRRQAPRRRPSLGAQRQSVAPRAAHARPVSRGTVRRRVEPGDAGVRPATAAAARPAPPARPPSGTSRWLGPIAGIAAGLGLAALLSHFGLSEGFGELPADRAARRRRSSSSCGCCCRAARAGRRRRFATARRWRRRRPRHVAALPAGQRDHAARVRRPHRADLGRAQRRARAPPLSRRDSSRRRSSSRRSSSSTACRRRYDAGDREALADVMTPEMYREIVARSRRARARRSRPRSSRSTPKCSRSRQEGDALRGKRPLHGHAARGRRA